VEDRNTGRENGGMEKMNGLHGKSETVDDRDKEN
jgi:hypothetical protein